MRQAFSLCPAASWLPSPGAPFRVHLQWFAAEDEGRTEEPSEHKLRKAREEGKVAKSPEVTSALLLLVGAATLGLLATHIMRVSIEMVTFFLARATSPDILLMTGAFGKGNDPRDRLDWMPNVVPGKANYRSRVVFDPSLVSVADLGPSPSSALAKRK